MKLLNNKRVLVVSIAVIGLAASAPSVYAQSTAGSELNQQINAGVISTDIRNESNVVVSTPSFAMSAASVSTSVQTITGTFGSNTQRISVDNPGGANSGWTLALNATTPGTGVWTNGTNSYPYNGTTTTGQLTVNPSVGVINATTGGSTGVTLGSQASFSGSTPITLVTAGATSADIWNGYFTGIGLSQVIPASTPAGTYTFDLTQTVTAS